jgi:L-fuculose-phosphate aldolase
MAMTKAERALRQEIIDQCRWMNASGLNQGTSGNLSVRHNEAMLITPSGQSYDDMTVAEIAAMSIDGAGDTWTGPLAPSSEWRFHRDILRTRPDVNAVVHTHSTYATALAIARKPIPACHYMIAAAGGNSVPCAQYATFGSAALSANVLAALDGRTGCLIENHGLIATGDSLKKAMWLAVEIETLAKQYYLTLAIGGPILLDDTEIDRVKKKFKTYGLRSATRGKRS